MKIMKAVERQYMPFSLCIVISLSGTLLKESAEKVGDSVAGPAECCVSKWNGRRVILLDMVTDTLRPLPLRSHPPARVDFWFAQI